MIKKLNVLGILWGIFSLNGCTLPVNATRIGINTFTLSSYSRNVLYMESTRFCRENSLLLKPVRERTVQGMIVLDFKCLSRNSKSYKRDSTYEVSDRVIITSNMNK